MVNFKTEKVTERITRIFGISGEMWYLVTGEETAALLDTGSGIGHMKPLIDSLTDKPMIILLTHGHVDHAMGATEFDVPVYMNPLDDSLYEEHSGFEVRKRGLANGEKEIVNLVEESDFIAPRTGPFLPLKEGDSFDLGGLHVDIYACPGHTQGSMVFLLREERIVLLGDACGLFTFLFFDYSSPVPEYKQTLLQLKEKLAGKYDRVISNHGTGEVEIGVLDGVIAVCDDILEGRSDDIPFDFRGLPAYIAKAMTEIRVRADGGVGNIVYKK